MKSTYWKMLRRAITGSMGRFLAIFAIVALGTGFFAGLIATAPDMRLAVGAYYDEAQVMDLRVMSTLGLTDDDAAAIADVDGVAAVMPAYSADVLTAEGTHADVVTRVHSLPDEGATWLNRVTLLEGRMPTAADECVAVRQKFGAPPAVGATVAMQGETDALNVSAFTVVGIVDSAWYFSIDKEYTSVGNGTVAQVLYAPSAAFAAEAYSALYVQVAGAADQTAFSTEYDDTVAAVGERVQALADSLAERRYDEVTAPAREQLDEARAALAQQREAAAARFAETEQTIALLRQSGNAAAATAAEQAYAAAQDEAARQFADAEAQIAASQDELDAVKVPTLYVQDRAEAIASYAGFDTNCEKVSAIAVVFPAFFLLVAALVALTTMTRMVEEERGQIGVLRALGYGKGAVMLKYLLYAWAATLTGAAVGLSAGMFLFPRAIYQAYGIMYRLPPLTTPFRWDYALIIGAAALLCTGLATLSACARVLHERPARLMMPKAPKAGKRVFLEYLPLWRHLSFLHKVTARNLLRYKKRFFMTAIGVAGCTALLLTGFGLHDSIAGIVGRQYDVLCHYDLTAVFADAEALTGAAGDAVRADERVARSLVVSQESADAEAGDATQTAYLFVPQEPADMADFFTLRERVSGAGHTLDDTAALLTEKAAERLGVSAGDTVTVTRTDGRRAEIPVGGVVENYVYSYLYVSPALYRQCFGDDPVYKTLLVQERDDADTERLREDLLATGDVSAVMAVADVRSSFSDLLKSLDYIVMILIVSAGLLAFVVLYNLTNINITERQRELATLKVLGFYDGETAAYIYRENGVLTLIGTLAGLVGGIFLHRFVVRTAEVDMVMFERVIHPLSFLWAALLTLMFAALVDVVMLRRLRRIDMVESMKSGE